MTVLDLFTITLWWVAILGILTLVAAVMAWAAEQWDGRVRRAFRETGLEGEDH